MQRLIYPLLLLSLALALAGCNQKLKAVGVVKEWQDIQSMAVADNYAYIAQPGSILILGLSKPMAPTPIGTYKLSGDHVVVKGDYAYVINSLFDHNDKLQVLDISNPQKPLERGVYQTNDRPQRALIKDDYLYLTTFKAGLHVIDISDPTRPRRVYEYIPQGRSDAIALKDQYLYVGVTVGGSDIIEIVDISNPAMPVKAAEINAPNFINDLEIVGDYAYLAAHDFYILDVSQPTSPKPVGSLNTPRAATAVAVEGEAAYIADPLYGVWAVDISDPTAPREIGHYELLLVDEVAVVGDHLYAAGSLDGLFIFEIPR